MTKEQAIVYLCETLSLVANFDDYKHECDCICEHGFLQRPIVHDMYLCFVREAVLEKIQKRKETHGQQADQEQTERETA
jgi:hypothetical protein